MQNSRSQHTAVAVRPPNLFVLAVSATATAAKNYPKISIMWIIGLLFAILATGFSPKPEDFRAYRAALAGLKDQERNLIDAQYDLDSWEAEYYESKGWFFRCDEICQHNKIQRDNARRELRRVQADFDKKISSAKSHLGLFSTEGVSEARGLFWACVAGGKAFARRNTFYDAIFAGIGAMGRDVSLVEYISHVLFRLLQNIIFGSFGALIGFMWKIWYIITSYEPSTLTALGFFTCAMLAACSVVFTFLLGLGAASVGVVSGMLSIASANMGNIEAERRRPNLQGDRAHRD